MTIEQEVEFQISSKLKNVSLVAVSISAISKQMGFDEMVSYQIETCAVEAINNAIIHAYQKQSDKLVRIICSLSEKQLKLYIIDTGISMPTPIPEKLVDSDQECGRGWFIMKQWMDFVDYSTENGINTVCLTKTL